MSRLERLRPRDRHLLLALVEMELGAVRRPDLEDAQAQVLLADESKRPGDDWWGKALPLVGKVLGTPPLLTTAALLELERSYASAGTEPTRLDVTRAVLAHVRDWPDLDADGRRAAIKKQTGAPFLREVNAVIAAVNAHGLPVSAPRLHPPLTWGYGYTDKILEILVKDAQLVQTGERRNSWPVYDLPRREPPTDRPADDALEGARAAAPSPAMSSG